MTEKLLLLGAGGHANSCLDVIEDSGKFEIYGFIDNNPEIEYFHEYRVLGNDSFLEEHRNHCENAFITVGQIKSSQIRSSLYKKLLSFEYKIPTIISPKAAISRRSELGAGTIAMHGVIVNSSGKVGVNTILNTKSLIEHDVYIGSHCHIATGAIINGGSRIHDGTFIGSGTIVKHGITIGKNCIVSAGLFIDKDLENGTIIKK